MKTSLEWLSEFLPGSPALEANACGEALTHGGLPVEHYETHGADRVLDVEVTSNRSDCLSHLGVARELSALLGRPFRDVPAGNALGATGAPGAGAPESHATSIAIEAADLCPHYTARVIRNVKVGPSPEWMKRRLEAVGVRSINNVVDVTNYVLFELGQPLHAFDFDKLEGRRIVVRRARPGERIVAIDGRERTLADDMLVIADAARAVAVAGVMGGLESEVSASSVNVLLESARFDPLSVRKTSRALALKSDSSYRFERGIDPLLPERASLRAAELILQTAGGELVGGLVSASASGYQPKTLELRLEKLRRVLGIDVPAQDAVRALNRLQLSPELANDRIRVTVPSFRLDLNIEVDLIEEVALIIGYDKIPVRDTISIRLTPPDPAARAMETIRSSLVAAGYFESVTFSFVSDALSGDFVPSSGAHPTAPLMRVDANVRKADANLRPSILPGLLESVRHNQSVGSTHAHLFEIGSTFWRDANGQPREVRRLALVGGADVGDVRGTIETVLRRLDPNRAIAIIPDEQRGFASAACGRIEWGGQAIGHLGKIDRDVADRLSLRELPAAAELDLDPLMAGAQHVPQLKPLPKYPAVRRDLSLVLPEPTRYERVWSLVQELKPQWLESVEYVTTYRGKPLEKGQKSVTITLVFRSPAETLTTEQVDASVQRVVDAAREQGWSQRA
jgi:phenylalanyl-tRNA synthetase beta chain